MVIEQVIEILKEHHVSTDHSTKTRALKFGYLNKIKELGKREAEKIALIDAEIEKYRIKGKEAKGEIVKLAQLDRVCMLTKAKSIFLGEVVVCLD